MECAPVILFVFNRPMHMARTVAALQANELAEQTPLFIFCDGQRNEKEAERVRQVRELAKTVTGFKAVTIVEREKNYGLAGSIIDGVGRLCEQYGHVIVVEDDLITSPDFLRYMNHGLNLYADEERVASIHGYAYPVASDDAPDSYFLRGADCWGWATWARAWKHFEPDGAKLLKALKERRLARAFDYEGNAFFLAMLRNQVKGKNQSWAIRWHASAYLDNMLTLYPRQSLVVNSGFDGSGAHCSDVDYYAGSLGHAPKKLKKIPVEVNEQMRLRVLGFFAEMRRQRKNDFYKLVFSAGVKRIRKVVGFAAS
ncbi:glycosyltransferase family 2 protein [Rhizobium leguminosarum]|uniref:glycosyltransferase family 2 protein n=1 Tax=Rhizobium leguminosarum TaxID=384 RepID=UPI001C979E84|nr:glycosyltransferase family 2 protein [Rhizobium leguminosarum]MBY5348765.1 glycosyltransferase family 2 protein [Rhizobium leguminosarum]